MRLAEVREARLRAIQLGETLSADEQAELLEHVEDAMEAANSDEDLCVEVSDLPRVCKDVIERCQERLEEFENYAEDASDELRVEENALLEAARAILEAIRRDGGTRSVKERAKALEAQVASREGT